MPVEKQIIEKLLIELKDYIYDIENMNFTEDNLLQNRDIQHLLNHRLHTAVEICIDIAVHIAGALELPGRESASDVILLIGKNGIISRELAERFQKAPGLRNLLIHGYTQIDYSFLFRDYRKDLGDIKQFALEIKNYTDKLS